MHFENDIELAGFFPSKFYFCASNQRPIVVKFGSKYCGGQVCLLETPFANHGLYFVRRIRLFVEALK